jgi:hypothetical protein
MPVKEAARFLAHHGLDSSFNHLETYESQWEGLSHILWKVIKFMFQTTKQIYMYSPMFPGLEAETKS